MKIFETRVTDEPSASQPGTIHIAADRRSMTVDTATTRLELLSVQAPGKRRMATEEFLRGCRLVNMVLG